MRQQHVFLATGVALVAAATAMLGCDSTSMTNSPVGGGGMGFMPGGAGGSTQSAPGVAGTGAGTGGVPSQVGTSGASAAGSGGVPAPAGMGGPIAGIGGVGGSTAGAGGDASGGGGGGGAEPGVVTNCGSADNVDEPMGPGPFTPTHIENGGGGSSWVFYPMEIGRDGCKHPIFNWGPGAGTGPREYTDHLNHLASHGFVIISQPSSGDGGTEIASLEWLMEQNDAMASPFYQKLDTTKVVMGGHSLGALTTFAMADFEPLTHYILVCGGSFGAPTGAMDIHGPAIILGGDTDTGTPNFEDDYEAIPTPVIFLIKSGTDHIACARNNLAPWTAFMRWQLYGETKWKADFFDGGKYCTAPWDSCESKGW